MKFTLTRKGNDRAWPGYIFWGRVRTSTAGLVVAFAVLFWAYQTFQPAPKPPEPAAGQIVPPGFVPDPAYTWVPRTNVSEPTPRRTYTPTEEPTTTSPTTTTTTTTTTSPTSPTSSTPSTSPAPGAPSTVDPDGPGPLPPTTVTSPAPRTLLPGITLPPLPAPPAPATR